MATQNATDTPKLTANGQLMIGSGSAQPVAATLTQPAAGITITNGAGSITFALANDLAALEGLGSTGFAVRSGADTWVQRSIVVGSSKLTISNGDGVAGNASLDADESAFTLNNIGGTLGETKGGTNQTTYTTGDILYASAGNTLSKLAIGSNTHVLTSNGTIPGWSAPSAGGMTWTEVTGTSQSAAVGNGYIANNAGLVTVTIPTTAAVGSIVAVVGKGAGLWRVAQNASESINFSSITTTVGTGGYLEATNRYDCVEIICTVADTTWTVRSSIGNITYN